MENFEVKMKMEIYYKGDNILYWDVDREEEWEAFLTGDKEEILELIKQEVNKNCGPAEDNDGNVINDDPDDYGVIFWLDTNNGGEQFELARYGRVWL